MSGDVNTLQEAKEKLNELLEAAKAGSIIPIRLPGQIEEIGRLLGQAEEAHAAELKEAESKAGPADMQQYMEDEAHFVGHAVHELNTPLTSIKGYSDMLGSMGELNDMQKQFLDTVKTNVKRMQYLLSDFRYLNKIRKGTYNPEPKMDMFANVSGMVKKELDPLVEELNRTLEIDVPGGLPYLNSDTHLLAMALTKLTENALRYTPGDDGVVKISAEGDNGYLVIKISDNGIGMTEEEMSHLGEIYFRGERDEVIAFKGSGLGIPLAYGILDLIGATVAVESEVDKGTTFIVRIKGMG